jgi:hypothetical protein
MIPFRSGPRRKRSMGGGKAVHECDWGTVTSRQARQALTLGHSRGRRAPEWRPASLSCAIRSFRVVASPSTTTLAALSSRRAPRWKVHSTKGRKVGTWVT